MPEGAGGDIDSGCPQVTQNFIPFGTAEPQERQRRPGKITAARPVTLAL
jgi:hypothetical protein